MPLSRAKNRERMQKLRATCVQPKPVQPVQPKIEGLIMDGNRIIGVQPTPGRANGKALHEGVTGSNEGVPLYNPSVHRLGDTVMMQSGKKLVKVTIPELDGDGNSIPDFT